MKKVFCNKCVNLLKDRWSDRYICTIYCMAMYLNREIDCEKYKKRKWYKLWIKRGNVI